MTTVSCFGGKHASQNLQSLRGTPCDLEIKPACQEDNEKHHWDGGENLRRLEAFALTCTLNMAVPVPRSYSKVIKPNLEKTCVLTSLWNSQPPVKLGNSGGPS